ncbi:geranylgeranyl transferase type-2 subunit alpha [Drosophila ficusphila]|uniref:geranylgeranyl transferase type-2 subunit alpha n=1 Tax=Drosophila ficusphila TaxID=30025 RepID=UPI0007E60D53|nr:geranylgeranyl transferase type-2 subunit alpha [Drosophila ficusphila]XP_017044310.1 geranylgeranyl transferase type-2 subunit alpha [Drosophila ficusphila]
MHGRVKVRTTEEERERKKKEQALKVRAYRAAMGRIQKKRAAGELDNELLTLTVQILQRNPDVSTLWNIRRECVLEKLSKLKEEQEQVPQQEKEEEPTAEEPLGENPKVKEPLAEDMAHSIFTCELDLTEQCLMVNPKSYNAWHHRCWTLEQNPQADWQRELQLCNKYLKFDERNFHTWDYRRYVTGKAAVPAAQELDFCTEKIKVNFSNYSSWHHRSLLLPELYPNERRDRPMSEEKLQQELEMVLTAAFTDPNDSSAWFYQRWLLGSGAQLDRAPRIAAFRLESCGAVLALDKPYPDLEQLKTELVGGGQRVLLQSWLPVDSCGTSWKCQQAFDYQRGTAYSLKLSDQEVDLLPLPGNEEGVFYFAPPHAAASCSKELLAELNTQLQSCLDLLEYEPNSKWTLLTSALLMRAIDVSANHEKSLEHLVKLEKVDALREGYYKDLAARWILESELAKWPQAEEFPRIFALKNDELLASLPYGQYFVIVDELKLSTKLTEKLGDLVPKTFADLKLQKGF